MKREATAIVAAAFAASLAVGVHAGWSEGIPAVQDARPCKPVRDGGWLAVSPPL